MLHLTLSAESPCVEDVLSVLGDAEQVDDGVPHHGHQCAPEQEDLVTNEMRVLTNEMRLLTK